MARQLPGNLWLLGKNVHYWTGWWVVAGGCTMIGVVVANRLAVDDCKRSRATVTRPENICMQT